MTNLITSDFYRLRKGAAARNTLIGLLGTTVFIAIILMVVSSEAVLDYMTVAAEKAPGQFVSMDDSMDIEKDIADLRDSIPKNAGAFGMEMVSENFLPFFFLPLIIAIFAADFSAGTYRNTLSYETDRTKVYLSKLVLSVACCIGLAVAMLLFSWLIGAVLFGGFGGAGPLMGQTLVAMLLQLPVNLGIICFGHCLVAFTKKSGSTIAAYLLTLIILSVVVQIAGIIFKSPYIQLLDWSSAGGLMADYQNRAPGELAFSVVYGLLVAVGSTALGLSRYKTADMA